MLAIRRILCPIDFSDDSRHALAHATALRAAEEELPKWSQSVSAAGSARSAPVRTARVRGDWAT